MDSQPMQNDRPANPRRKQRTKMETFREAYLPFLIVAASVLVIVTVIGSIASSVNNSHTAGATADNESHLLLQQEANSLLTQADALAAAYDYDGALAALESFSGDRSNFPQITEAIESYTQAKKNLVKWTAADVPTLSFHTLVADLEAALADGTYGKNGNDRYNKNFITTDEFTAILQQLYNGGYVLVDIDDLYYFDEEAQTYAEKELHLPVGKQPVLLVQTHCSYYTYMESSHAFATKLCYDGSSFYNEMTTTAGEAVTGNYDLVPILEQFIQAHSGFSYQGARAILAFSGYDGIFGYRVADSTAEAESATTLVQALREAGYTVACYTYQNISYGSSVSTDDVKSDIEKWVTEIQPIVGETEILVFAQESDIGTNYEDTDKFDVLYDQGFRFFMSNGSFQYHKVAATYVRHNRLMVTGSTLCYHADRFSDILNTENLLDDRRGTIPE